MSRLQLLSASCFPRCVLCCRSRHCCATLSWARHRSPIRHSRRRSPRRYCPRPRRCSSHFHFTRRIFAHRRRLGPGVEALRPGRLLCPTHVARMVTRPCARRLYARPRCASCRRHLCLCSLRRWYSAHSCCSRHLFSRRRIRTHCPRFPLLLRRCHCALCRHSRHWGASWSSPSLQPPPRDPPRQLLIPP